MATNHYDYSFKTDYPSILNKIDTIDPKAYARSRNYIDGAVTQLSPYISRGVISTKQVFQAMLEKGYSFSDFEKFAQELAWRDYWQQVWIAKGDAINEDLRHEQKDVKNHEIASAVVNATTNISAIDNAIKSLYKTGYIHNHIRMYIAAICCNMAKNHWRIPARWMYYHLIDGDWASNALSWQWVAGSNSNKKYVANQENINKYCHTQQQDTFVDVPYDAFDNFSVPQILEKTVIPQFNTLLPKSDPINIDATQPCYLHTYYNLDPQWAPEGACKILILEPSHFKKYPVSENVMDFALKLSKNIKDIQLFVGEFKDFATLNNVNNIHYKEHPTNQHFTGTKHARDWMTSVTGYFPSFFKFWNRAKKELKRL